MNANKPRAPGSTKEIVDELVDVAGGPKQVAFVLGMHPSTIAAYTDPAIATHMNYDQVRRLTERGHTLAAEDLARLAGGVFMPLKQDDRSIADRLLQVVVESNDLDLVVAQAHADGQLSDVVKANIAREASDVITVLARLVCALEPTKANA